MTHNAIYRFPAIALVASATACVLLASCGAADEGPILISAIGEPPAVRDPNKAAVDPPSALMLQTTAQGLVRYDAAGQIVPALAQRWIVSDDGLRYTFRLARTEWSTGGKVTASQVVARIKAAAVPVSRNSLKPLLGAVDEVVAMTDDVLEISLKSPRPNFLQLLAQPEMAILRNLVGSGPYVGLEQVDGAVLLRRQARSDDEQESERPSPPLRLRGENAALSIVRFRLNQSHLVTGGTIGNLLLTRLATELPPQSLRFDPVAGLLGLSFARADGAIGDPAVRDALSMAIDRDAIVATMNVPGLRPRTSLLPPGTDEVGVPIRPGWSDQPLPLRVKAATERLAPFLADGPLQLRVALPPGPGYRLLFAELRRDWRRIGVIAQAVEANAPADMRLIDEVAPVTMASWYLRHFTCSVSPLCSAEADFALEAARLAPNQAARAATLAQADALLSAVTPFISLTAPVRWSLVSPRLTGFQPSIFALHPPDELILPRR